MNASSPTFSEKEKKEVDLIIAGSSGEVATFSDRFLGDNAGRYIFQSLKSTDSGQPKVIECKGCYFGLESALSLADLLKDPSCKVEKLSLEWNSLGSFENGLAEVASALALNTSLVTLDLRNNNIGPNGGSMIARGLRDNRTLSSLDIRWNEIGNPGGLSFKELFTTGSNSFLKNIKLAGNKMSDVILTEIEGAMSKRAVAGGGLSAAFAADEIHVVKGKMEELQKDLAKLSAENMALKDENKKKDGHWQIQHAKSKSETSFRVENLEKQLSDSASTVSLLEIEVLREKERADRLQDQLVKEQRDKDVALSNLRVERESIASKKIANDREKSQLATSLKITEETLEVLRTENDALRRNFGTREKELLTQLSDRERKLSEARREEDNAKAEQSRVEVELGDAKLKEKMAEERASQSAKLLDDCIEDRARQVEEARKNVEENLESVRTELTSRLKSAEARASEAEAKQMSAETKARKAESRAAAASVVLEQKLSDQAFKMRKEFSDMADGETRELAEALDVVKAQRDSQDVAMTQLSADLENMRDMRQREAESAKRTIENLNKNLADALKEARRERGAASDLKLEVAGLKRQIDPFKRKVEVCQAEKKRTEEFRTRDVENLQSLLANEREERAREALSYQKRLDSCNEMLRAAREGISEQRTNHLKEFHRLEKGMIAAVQAIFTDRKNKGFGEGGKGVKKGNTSKSKKKEDENEAASGNAA
ncbi:hypothetical protein TrCOL_g9409 [Triparma columacea]|jgi:hypothetical protein|uniref:Uncharacterized protein n=1 Tax=Triparma columacea TaxID=722753 RepID=A0A9W7G5P7_9STRA|nr:hypothetical protein TrCOL_g9409 [Triparma columacea]